MSATVTPPLKSTRKADVGTAIPPISPPPAVDPLEALVEHYTSQLAYSYWEARGCPVGTPLEDWLNAEREIQRIQRERPSLTNLAAPIEQF
jgi:hypothetical protein